MTGNPRRLRLYTVVDVWRGIAAGARSFARLGDAQRYARQLSRGRNLLEDDIKLFQTSVRIPMRRKRVT